MALGSLSELAATHKIRVDPEFRALIPTLSDEERRQLEVNLLADGCRDPLVVWDGTLLDGHNRLDLCQAHAIPFRVLSMSFASRDDAKVWVIENQFGRRNLQPFQRAELAMTLEPLIAARAKLNQQVSDGRGAKGSSTLTDLNLRPVDTRAELARVSGLSAGTIHKAKVIAEKAPEPIKEQLRKGNISINRAYKDVRRSSQKQEREEAKRLALETVSAVSVDERADLRVCDMLTLLESLRGLDAIITDPPYGEDAIPLYAALAKAAAAALAPSGVLAVMCGQSYLPRVLQEMAAEIPYRWTMAYLTPGGQSPQIWPRKVNTFWKPVLLFGAPERWIGDVVKSDTNDNDKRFHHWGQSESGMARLIEALTEPDALVCDPFLGGGTTGVVALALGRRFVGADSDAGAVALARQRLAS